MLARSNRFHGHNSVQYVYRKGQIARGQLCALKYAHNNRRKDYRAAVVVSRKVHKSAVVRNRIRRRVYEFLRRAKITGPWDIVVVIYSEEMATIGAEELQTMLSQMLERAGIPHATNE